MAWTNKTGAVNDSLSCVFGFPGVTENVWAGGAATVWFWDGSSWAAQSCPSGVTVQSIFGVADDDLWAVCVGANGSTGNIAHWDGAAWTDSEPTTQGIDFLGVGGAATDDIWAVGYGGAIWHWDGAAWTDESGITAEDLWGVYALTTADVWVVGSNGTTLHWDGATWTDYANGLGIATILRSVHGTPGGEVLAVGEQGVIIYWDGAVWSQQTSGVTTDLQSVFVSNSTDIWVAGCFNWWFHMSAFTASPQPVTEDNGYAGTWGPPADNGGHVVGVLALETLKVWSVNASIQAFYWDGPGTILGNALYFMLTAVTDDPANLSENELFDLR